VRTGVALDSVDGFMEVAKLGIRGGDGVGVGQ